MTPEPALPGGAAPAVGSIDVPRGGVLHLWLCRAPHDVPAVATATLRGWLDAEEQTRLDRLRRTEDQRGFLQAHAFLRCVLAAYGRVRPGDCRFAREVGGRPVLVAPALGPLELSLAHTSGLVACLVSGAGVCGVDAEALDATRSLSALRAGALTPAEQAGMAVTASGTPPERFFDLWTVKEAYLKARGLGLQVPLTWITVELGPRGPRLASLDPALGDDPCAWQVRLVPVGSPHRLAVVAQSREPVEVVVRTAPPPRWPLPPA